MSNTFRHTHTSSHMYNRHTHNRHTYFVTHIIVTHLSSHINCHTHIVTQYISSHTQRTKQRDGFTVIYFTVTLRHTKAYELLKYQQEAKNVKELTVDTLCVLSRRKISSNNNDAVAIYLQYKNFREIISTYFLLVKTSRTPLLKIKISQGEGLFGLIFWFSCEFLRQGTNTRITRMWSAKFLYFSIISRRTSKVQTTRKSLY